MPRSASDFMDIYSAADSYDTWSRSHDDDETDSRTSEYSSRDHYRRGGGRRRLRTMDYLEEENSIIDSQGESSVSEIDGTRRRRRRRRQHRDETNSYATDEVNEDEDEAAKRAEYSTVRKSSSNPFDDSTTEATLDAGDPLNENRTTTSTSGQNEYYEAKKQAEYLAARRSMYNPFEDTESEASSLPSDERIGINRPRSQRMRPRRQPQEQLYSAGSLLDEDNPLSPVEEDSAVSSRASFDISPLPSDEHSGNETARQTRGHLSRTFSDGRQPSPTFGSRRIDGLQKESALRPHPRAAERVEHYPDPSYSLSLSSSSPKKANSSDPSTGDETVSSTGDENQSHYNENVALHDLCSEATSPDDVAWRNALYLLSIEPELATRKEDGWSPLHVCCLGSAPPPDFMVRAILYCEPACARAIDEGGRLPLHMIAASSADTSIMQLLVEEYPSAVYKTDARGLTPLHMLMRNDDVELTMDRIRVLLGQTVRREKGPARNARIVQRRGQHLELNIDEINDRMVNRPPPGDGELDISFESQEGDQRHEIQIKNYPDDVQAAFQKLAMWKRKQKRLNQDPNDSPINIDLAQSHKDEEKNPAAIAAPPSMQLPLHMAVRRRDLDDDESFRDEGDDYFDIKNPLPPNRNEILRVIIAAYPRGLVTRDANGNTPLMIVLLNQDCLPDIELIQLLLGMTTSGFQSPPPWADDLPLHKCPQGKYANPAMVPTTDTNQLPLHVAAEEMPSFYSAIESIHSAYPGAVVVQDVRGRTPLHMALRNYQRIQPDPKVVSLLLTDKVAQIRDDDGFLPFDLLVGGAHNLPKEEPMPSLWEDSTFDPSSVYKRFFIYVVMQAPRPRNRIEARAFLGRLRMLPPWLRRQACTVGFIQDMLIYEIASPEKCAFIILNGIVLALLLLMFRLQMDEYTSTGSAQVYYLPFVYLLGSLILLGQFINFCIATSHSVFWSQCMLNIWPWIDIVSVSVAMAATSLIQGESADVAGIASVGTAATGLLWASIIGYIARWWYGMAVFMGRTLRMFHLLVWPLIAALVLIVSFAEMFYSYNVTTSQEECDTSFGNRSLCTMREAFITVYLMLLGTPVIDTEDDSQNSLSSGSVVLISVFTTLLVLFIVSLLITVVSESMRMDLDDVALGYFWEPKLNFVFTVDDILNLFSCPKEQSFEKCGGTRKKRFVPKRSCGDRLSSFLGDAWTVMDYAIFGGERRRGNMWYVAYCDNASPFGVWPLRIICLIIIPVWLVIGLATFGLLWPPQIRRWLFRPSRSSIRNSREANAAAEYSGTQVAGMRGDVLQLKTMSYERSNDIKREILELKRLLYDAMEE